ncbi:hypothetical protein HK101_002139 [Irineochytrium annulatum]|nr:hypothetical protein HK101_002139 [Irineochytrium annulatum]
MKFSAHPKLMFHHGGFACLRRPLKVKGNHLGSARTVKASVYRRYHSEVRRRPRRGLGGARMTIVVAADISGPVLSPGALRVMSTVDVAHMPRAAVIQNPAPYELASTPSSSFPDTAAVASPSAATSSPAFDRRLSDDAGAESATAAAGKGKMSLETSVLDNGGVPKQQIVPTLEHLAAAAGPAAAAEKFAVPLSLPSMFQNQPQPQQQIPQQQQQSHHQQLASAHTLHFNVASSAPPAYQAQQQRYQQQQRAIPFYPSLPPAHQSNNPQPHHPTPSHHHPSPRNPHHQQRSHYQQPPQHHHHHHHTQRLPASVSTSQIANYHPNHTNPHPMSHPNTHYPDLTQTVSVDALIKSIVMHQRALEDAIFTGTSSSYTAGVKRRRGCSGNGNGGLVGSGSPRAIRVNGVALVEIGSARCSYGNSPAASPLASPQMTKLGNNGGVKRLRQLSRDAMHNAAMGGIGGGLSLCGGVSRNSFWGRLEEYEDGIRGRADKDEGSGDLFAVGGW